MSKKKSRANARAPRQHRWRDGQIVKISKRPAEFDSKAPRLKADHAAAVVGAWADDLTINAPALSVVLKFNRELFGVEFDERWSEYCDVLNLATDYGFHDKAEHAMWAMESMYAQAAYVLGIEVGKRLARGAAR
jgi:hypothetical protein